MNERTIWLLTAAVVVTLAAYFSARAVGYVVGAKAFPESAQPSLEPPKRVAQTKKQKPSKDGTPVVERNMFCLDCVVAPVPTGPVDGDGVVMTSLPLALLATNTSTAEKYSFATIRNTQSYAQGAYWVGDMIPGAGEVVEIDRQYVDFTNETTKQRERMYLFGKKPAVVAERKPPTKRKDLSKLTGRKKILAELSERVEKISDTEYVVDRAAVEKAMDQPWVFARQARLRKARKNGEEVGVRLFSIKPNSLLSKIGMVNGDTLHSINGRKISFNVKDALDMMVQLKSAGSIEVTATRRGKPVTLKYTIR